MKILVTGNAGFIGHHVFKRLVKAGHEVVGVDNLNNYYDVNLKLARLKDCGFDVDMIAYGRETLSASGGRFIQLNLEERADISNLFKRHHFDYICHLAAQAGVRYSLENPHAYVDSNIVGFLNILEECRYQEDISNIVYASSSSVYGANAKIPFSISDSTEHPISLYAATKKCNELIAHCYNHLFNIPLTGLRFFTVYGPWGRPDMALFKFTRNILEGKPIEVYNHGDMQRDFTYIDDIVDGIVLALFAEAKVKGGKAANKIYNIGNGQPVSLLAFIHAIEKYTGKSAELQLLPLQAGDVYKTWANIEETVRDLNYCPKVDFDTGVGNFVRWYCNFYGI